MPRVWKFGDFINIDDILPGRNVQEESKAMNSDVQKRLAECRTELGALAEQFQVVRLELFGSANTADFDAERSDLDFLVEFAPNTDLGPWLRRFFELREAMGELLGRPVDLVMMNALNNPRFRQEADATRQVIYAP